MAPLRSHNCTIRGPAPPDLHVARNGSLPGHQAPFPLGGLFADTPMSFLTPEKAVRALLHQLAPQLPVERIEPIPSAGVQQLYIIHLINKTPLLLALPPPPDVKPLRCERGSIAAEVALLKWLSNSISDKPGMGRYNGKAKWTTSGYQHQDTATLLQESGSVTPPPIDNYLKGFAPRLVQHSLPQSETNSPELILTDPPAGTTISTIQAPIGTEEQKSVDRQAGHLFRRISCHVSPTGNFGYAVDVLRRNSQMPVARFHHDSTTPPSDTGFPTWSQAFHLLLESVLRDLEDTWVQISYRTVRAHFERLRHLLDRVKRPSLVAIEGGEETNLLVSVPGGSSEIQDLRSRELGKGPNGAVPGGLGGSGGTKVTGLRDWSNCIFGDPLIALRFANRPSQEFLEGLNTPIGDSDPFDHAGVIEDRAHAPERLALYECYHSLCGIARQYRRPRDVEVDMELYWRKRLQDSLASLSTLGGEGDSPQ
ncbi:hypothetical protein ACRE_063640 [Hapsidospora chrysogenum ATCC 11550]|uniref:Aminoglycoside phosphotransferase domain-containing protein n=1 Tax=Hapsidospora chrysogenum (strain ATCC 11550 / CBS 779.69 / DSM 880 / IAM 14645 / JCM 23072 / IMI 49137) TaxID=857340 RepID=A0A086T0N0_HAPC1|nr:hypothetical protein ACRE_063640 [Hapsidospora chrysogenum ATCC 11550]